MKATRDFAADIDASMAQCPKCEMLTPEKREAHRTRVMREVLRKQSQPPATLPEHVWRFE